MNLPDRRLALLELSKGRVTTDSANHSGEGIFFTSRAFSSFRLQANGIAYERSQSQASPVTFPSPPALPAAAGLERPGTLVQLALRLDSPVVLRELFAHYTTGAPDDLTFDRTVVPVKLARLGRENLLSRSQARRITSRVDGFRLVVLDFEGVPEIGQAFAVMAMIRRVFAG